MTHEQYERGLDERGLDIFRDSEADEDFRRDSEVRSPDPTSAGNLTREYPVSGTGATGLDDSGPTPATSDPVPESMALSSESGDDLTGSAGDPADDLGDSPTIIRSTATGEGSGAANGAKEAAGHAVEKAGDVAGSAAGKAGELKDVALERGGDVAAVAKDELARLAQDARTEVQSLWSNASEQLKGQAAIGQQQVSELLHSLAGELGEMASKSQNTGPLTALAKQAAAKGGEWSQWLATSEPADVLTQLRRFARRRPFVFLAGAAVAGVVVGRLGRGLMAVGDQDVPAPARLARDSTGSVPATSGVTTPPPVTYEEVPSFGTGEPPEHFGSLEHQATADNPDGVGGGAR